MEDHLENLPAELLSQIFSSSCFRGKTAFTPLKNLEPKRPYCIQNIWKYRIFSQGKRIKQTLEVPNLPKTEHVKSQLQGGP